MRTPKIFSPPPIGDSPVGMDMLGGRIDVQCTTTGASAAAAVLLTEEEKAQTSRELDEDFRRIEQEGAY